MYELDVDAGSPQHRRASSLLDRAGSYAQFWLRWIVRQSGIADSSAARLLVQAAHATRSRKAIKPVLDSGSAGAGK